MLARPLLAIGVFAILAVGCSTAKLTQAPNPAPNPNDTAMASDEPSDEDEETTTETSPGSEETKKDPKKEQPKEPDPPAHDGVCPAPLTITPADVPAGYLPPVKVKLQHLIDGDSEDFDFPNASKQGVRMLFINTEESGGAEMTPFGVKAKGIVHGWFKAATEIQIAVREKFPLGSGQPDLDPYGRWLSLVFLDGELLQTKIVREGLSAYYVQFGCAPTNVHQALLHAESEANEVDRGIWSSTEVAHNDYAEVLTKWIGSRTCRPNPFKSQPYCQ